MPDPRFEETLAYLRQGAEAAPRRALSPAEEGARVEQAIRWRLVLGQFADEHLGLDRLGQGLEGQGQGGQEGGGEGGALGVDLAQLLTEARQLDTPLSYIYDREHEARQHRRAGASGGAGLSVPMWLNQVRKLFPREASQVIEKDALSRYGLTELVTDARVLREAIPNEALLKAIIQFKHLMNPEVLEAARAIVRAVVAEMADRLESECRPALHGPVEPEGQPLRTFRNADWARTIRRNLKHYDLEDERLIIDRVFYRHRQKRRSDWRIIVAVDQSGSMTDSLIHSAVMAGIFSALPSVEVNLVLWDHRVLDVSHLADDPLEVLMSCQLGGGTQMYPAMAHCEGLITEPHRTIFVLLSDWYIWGEREKCLAMAKKLHEAGVKGIGLSALDADAQPVYDARFAQDLADMGWFVAALTPKKLAEHVGKIIA
ncbi:VWA domain-containing protein [Myxococcota bacterium]|nr:VWA domain-containing protein [Myxococcota bacterium]MBU1897320.1 VWA domain-containing protein [Myxococcota bacterium]